MKPKNLITISTLLLLIISSFWYAMPVNAAAYGTQFITSIAYMNIGSGDATITLTVYDSVGNPTDITLDPLPPNAASELYVGSLPGIDTGMQSASMSSSEPLAVTLVQIPQAGSVKNRPLSNAFTQGSETVLISTVLKNMWHTNTIFTIQNVDMTHATDLEVSFIPVGGSPIVDLVTNLAPGASKFYDLGGASPISASSFNGSVVVTAKRTGTNELGAIVGTSLELSTRNNDTYAFEGFAEGSNIIYLPSAFCAWGAGNFINSSYAVQNISDTDNATVTVTYEGGKVDGPHVVSPGAKRSFQGCDVNPRNYIGSAIVTSTGAEIVAMAKIGGNALSTAYEGVTRGYDKIALPYVRWTANYSAGQRQQVNIAIQNVGNTQLDAGAVVVEYYDHNGVMLGTTTNPNPLSVGGKWSTNASSIAPEFGYPNGGGAIVNGPTGSQLAVMARAATYLTSTTAAGEDYVGIPIQ